MATSITTNNAESISYKQKQALVQAYAPQIRLHPSEKYFPADIDFALAACELRANDGSDAVIHDRITSQSLLMQTGSVPMESTYVHIVDEAAIIGNPPSDIGGISIFAKISTILYDDGTGKPPTEFWDILYNIFYMHNGSTVPGSTTIGAHSWDNETVIVRILPNYAPSADMIETIFFSQHSGGGWFKPSKLQFVGDNGIGAREAGGRGANNRSAGHTRCCICCQVFTCTLPCCRHMATYVWCRHGLYIRRWHPLDSDDHSRRPSVRHQPKGHMDTLHWSVRAGRSAWCVSAWLDHYEPQAHECAIHGPRE